jgi:hypothetical protein
MNQKQAEEYGCIYIHELCKYNVAVRVKQRMTSYGKSLSKESLVS